MRLELLVLLTLLLLIPTITLAEIMTVSFSGTEMRSAANAMSSKVISRVSPGTPLEVLEKEAEYYRVKDYRGRTGWVHRALLSSKPGVIITADRANVRQGPDTDYEVIFQLSKGGTCRVIEKQETWLKIQNADGQRGWVASFLTWGQ